MGDYVNSRLGNLMTYTIAIIVSLLSVTLILGTVLDWFGVKLLGGREQQERTSPLAGLQGTRNPA